MHHWPAARNAHGFKTNKLHTAAAKDVNNSSNLQYMSKIVSRIIDSGSFVDCRGRGKVDD